MLVKVTRDANGMVVSPGNPALSKYRANTVCLTDVTFESDGGIVGEPIEAIKKYKPPARDIRINWKRAELKDGVYVDHLSGNPVELTSARGAYLLDKTIWYLP